MVAYGENKTLPIYISVAKEILCFDRPYTNISDHIELYFVCVLYVYKIAIVKNLDVLMAMCRALIDIKPWPPEVLAAKAANVWGPPKSGN